MAKKASGKKVKKQHHRVKKLAALAMLTGAAYGAKRYLDSRKPKFTSKKVGE